MKNKQHIAQLFLKYYLLLSFLFYVIVTFYFSNIPFFWDSPHFSRQALFYYNNNFHSFFSPNNLDSGHPPFFAMYLASGWKLFGKTLLVSHLLILPFALGIIYFIDKITSRYLKSPYKQLAVFFVAIDSVFLMQTIYMNFELLMIFAFLFSLHQLYKNNRILFALGLSILVFSNIRGSLMVLSLLLIDIKINKFTLKNILAFVIPFLLFVAWNYIHLISAGWALVNPLDEQERGIANAGKMFRNFVNVIWKCNDFGKIFLSATIAILVLKKSRKELDEKLKELFFILFASLLFIGIVSIILTNPMGHRYFISINFFLILAFFLTLQLYFSKSNLKFIIFVLAVILFTGNWWYYPFKYSNGWDTSAKGLTYFKLEKELNHFLLKNQISKQNIAVSFPISIEDEATYLIPSSNGVYTYLVDDSITTYPYIIESNLCNNYSEKRLKQLEKLNLVKEFKGGVVFIRLYSQKKGSRQ